MKKVYYKQKNTALKKLTSNSILCNKNITSYFILENHNKFLECITTEKSPCFYEFIPYDCRIPLFFDVEIYKDNSDYFDNTQILLDNLYSKIEKIFEGYNISKIILESHNDIKKSFHIIVRVKDNNENYVLFENQKALKEFITINKLCELKDDTGKYIIDPSVYREGLFRTIYSSKSGENRPLIRNANSDNFEDIESFITYYNTLDNIQTYIEVVDVYLSNTEHSSSYENQSYIDEDAVNIPQELTKSHKSTIKKFIQKMYRMGGDKVRDIIVDKQYNCIVIALSDKFCDNINREHRSNNQYIVIDTCSAKQKCHDPECKDHKFREIKLQDYPKELSEIIKCCLKVNKHELELIDKAIEECKTYITQNFDENVQLVLFDKNEMVFKSDVSNNDLTRLLKGKCVICNVEHQISDNGYCLKCKICDSIFPKQQVIPVDHRYKTLNSFWMNYSQLINTGTINNIINIYNNSGEDDFSCEIKLDNSILKDKTLTNLINQVLDGHKITMISKLINFLNDNFVYSKNNWYFFNDSIWKSDNDSIEMKKEIIDLSKLFNQIQNHYETKRNDNETTKLCKNIKSIINKFHKPGFQDDIIKGAKIYYNDELFVNNLNSKKHLVPFFNGVYDLLTNSFRKTSKDDYVYYTVNYNYDETVDNPEVHKFINSMLPNPKVRDYVLKKLSECLNGDIPNTYFLMFIGDGANGKSQILNLMKLVMGDFGEKVEVTLLTRKRNNANEANSEKIKLMNKRFAFLSEPEDGEKINIGLLKELTGSEEIVARGLYQDAMSFVMEAKLFLACNELPEIKGEDSALWRRIRVIDFPSRFVDEPKESNEYKIDRTLPSRMREDITWRQTFMNILISYYYKDVPEPDEVKSKTNEYRDDNNEFYSWMDENIEYKKGEILKLQDVVQAFLGKKTNSRTLSKYKRELQKWIKSNYPKEKNEYQNSSYQGFAYKGWLNFDIKI